MGDRAEAIEVPDTLSQGLQLPLTLDDESHALSLLEGEPVAGDSKTAIRTDAGRDVGKVVGVCPFSRHCGCTGQLMLVSRELESSNALFQRQKRCAMAEKRQPSCPSSVATIGSELFGIVNKDGEVDYLRFPLQVTREFLLEARRGRPPEERFRFTSPCAKGKCAQWNGDKCRVAEIIARLDTSRQNIPACTIRKSCQWFYQEGIAACNNCSIVAMKGAEGKPMT